MEISKMLQKPRAWSAALFTPEAEGISAKIELVPNNLTVRATSKTVSTAITTVVTFAKRRRPTKTQSAMRTASTTQVSGKEMGRCSPASTVAPWAFRTAIQATSWNRFKEAKNLEP